MKNPNGGTGSSGWVAMLSRTGFLFIKEWLKQGQISILEGEVEAGVLQTFQSGSEGL